MDIEALPAIKDDVSKSDRWSRGLSGITLRNIDAEESDKVSDHVELVLKKEKAVAVPPAVVGFWHKTLTRTRRTVFKQYLKTLLILCVFVLGVISIYWGMVCKVEDKLDQLKVAIVDFDGSGLYSSTDPIIGPVVVSAALAQLSTPRHLGYEIHSPADYGNDPMNVRLAVHDEKIWAAIVINSNATALLREAVQIGNASYDPLGAAQTIYIQARDLETYNWFIIPTLSRFTSQISASFSRNWTQSVLQDTSLDPASYLQATQALTPAIGFSEFNLRPFGPATAMPAVSVGLIYLIIIAFFSFGFFMPTHMNFAIPNPKSPHPLLKFHQLIIWRYLAALVAYLCMSLAYSLVSLAFQIPFSNRPPRGLDGNQPQHWPETEVVNNADYFGYATFIVYWMVNFCGMTALGLACENMAMLLGTPNTALWLIFWVITNVATGIYALELAPAFFIWGYAFPLRQVVMASKTLLFGTKDRLGFNFWVLAAWIGLSTVLYPFCCYFLRWKTVRTQKKRA